MGVHASPHWARKLPATKPLKLPLQDAEFFSDFEHNTDLDWLPEEAGGGTWAIEAGELSQSNAVGGWMRKFGGHLGWRNVVAEVRTRMITPVDAVTRVPGIAVRMSTIDSYIGFDYRTDTNEVILHNYLGPYNIFPWGSATGSFADNLWHTLKVIAIGQNYRCYIDGILQINADDTGANQKTEGKVGCQTYNSHSHFDDLLVKRL